MKDSKVLITDNTVSKSFSYQKNGVELRFTLRIDIKQQLKDFTEILEVALKEVREELDKK